VDLSTIEIETMLAMGEFYLPSFTSTSTGVGFDRKSARLIIDASEGERITLDIGNSPYRRYMTDYPKESEVLIAAYAKFRITGVEMPQNGSTEPVILFVKLLDPVEGPLEELREMLDLYHHAKLNHWAEVFSAINGEPHKAQIMVRYFKPTSGRTMLHHAAWWGNQAAVNQLMRLGADPTRKDKRGESAEEVKNEHGEEINWAEARSARRPTPLGRPFLPSEM